MTVSYSGVSMYVTCPSSFNRKYNLKEKADQPTRETAPAMFRGTDLHNAIEDFLLNKRNDLPKELKAYNEFCTGIRTHKAIPELAFAFDNKWESVEFDDPLAEIRGFMDAIMADTELIVYEWKTGKKYDEHANQRSLYGLAALILYPDYQKVRVMTVYLDQQEISETTYHKDMLVTYKWMWERKINSTKPPQMYPMRPSWKCKWCGYSKKKGGKCPN